MNRESDGTEISGPRRGEPLGSHDVHVWYTYCDQVRDTALVETCHAVLSLDERARQQRFVFERDRHQFLVARSLLRTTLSRYQAVAPAGWQFVTNEYGRPEIDQPETARRLRFNISHTRSLVVCAVTWDRDVGVDVESVDRSDVGLRVASRFFSTSEVTDLFSLPAANQRRAFFDYWTLKEAYIKARGMGLALPLSKFSYHLRPGSPVRISFAPDLADDPARWQFAQHQPEERHLISLAVAMPPEDTPHIVWRQTIPFGT